VVRCCIGPLAAKSTIQAPLTLASCANHVIPHKTIVAYNGRLVELTVATYDQCDQ
jgi:hypothetical protein